MDEKKIIDVLMDDDTFVAKKGKEKEKESTSQKHEYEGNTGKEKDEKGKPVNKIIGQKETKKTWVRNIVLPEIERCVLRSVVFEAKEPRTIARTTGYPEIVVKKALERLIEKGYLTEELEPTEKVSEVRWLKPVKVSIKYGKSTRIAVIDVAIAVAAIIFILSLAYYLGLFGLP